MTINETVALQQLENQIRNAAPFEVAAICATFRVQTLKRWARAQKVTNCEFFRGITKWTKAETIEAIKEILR